MAQRGGADDDGGEEAARRREESGVFSRRRLRPNEAWVGNSTGSDGIGTGRGGGVRFRPLADSQFETIRRGGVGGETRR